MIKSILFDCDGVIIKRDKYFSQRLRELGVELNDKKIKQFFSTDFLECQNGQKDLAEVLPKWIGLWGWEGSVEDLMRFWFEGEAEVEENTRDFIIGLRKKKVRVYLSTDNEKHRMDFLWNTVGLKNFFDGKLPSCELGALKSEKGFWQAAHQRSGNIDKSQVLVWDDAQSAIDAARAYGFNAEFYLSFKDFKKIMTEKYQLA